MISGSPETSDNQGLARLHAQLELTQALALAESVEEAAEAVVGPVWRRLGFDAGNLWQVDAVTGNLRQIHGWYTISATAFERMSREIALERGVGLPGRVWANGTPLWIPDVTIDLNFPRAQCAKEAQLRGAAAFPITYRSTVLGVLELFCHQSRDPDAELTALMGVLGGQIGQFFERIRVQEQLRHSEARYRAAVATALDCVIAMDDRGLIIGFNPAAEKIFGFSREEAMGKRVADLIVPPELRARHSTGIQRYLQTGVSDILGRRVEMPAIRKDGRQIAVELSITRNPGEPITFTAFLRDISERLATEERLRQSEERLRVSLETAPICVYTNDVELRYTWIHNPQAGFTAAEMLGKRDEELLPYESVADLIDLKRLTLSSNQRHRRQITCTIDGAEFTFDVTCDPTHDNRGTINGLVVAVLDITALVQAKRDAETASKAKDHFLAILSHELRTPLTPVLGLVSALEQDQRLPPEVLRDLQTIRRNVALEARLIDDLLDLTRVAKGKLQLHMTDVDVHAALQNIYEMFRGEVEAKGLRMDVALTAKQHFIQGDWARVQQMFWNLLRNAIKFTPQKGHIHMTTQDASQGRVAIRFVDSGIGIPPERLAELFRPFEQGDRFITQRFGGLGLGLSITKTLAELHEGTVRAESLGPGLGATFILEFPAADSPNGGEGSHPAIDTTISIPRRILLVEDHEDTARTMYRLLRAHGHDVKVAHDVASALAFVDNHKFDLVISDIGLPDGTGIDLLQKIRETQNCPAIAVTGFGMEDDIRQCLAAGFAMHLTKPMEFEKLESMIQKVANGG